ncbi:MAG: DUF748 domain-containing protein [Gammaproteobacteria bacterium]|nr:hypothetical protein [Gammaproteobacteria bacterium]
MQRRRRIILLSVAAAFAVLVAARMALPHVLERYLNEQLAAVEGYEGHVEDVDLALWRGGGAIKGLHIVRMTDTNKETFFDCDEISVALEWKSLVTGSLVAAGEAIRPVLNLVQAEDEERQQLGTEARWPTFLADYYPFEINTFLIRDGTVRLRTPRIPSEHALVATNVNVVLSNLTNVVDSGKETFADFQVTATVLDGAPLRIAGALDPLAEQPTFDVNLELEGVQLTDLNAWLREYARADAEAGHFQLYMEIAAADGAFRGYAKPLIQDVDISGAADQDDAPLRKAWEGLVEFATKIAENEEAEQVGARVPFSGTIDEPQTSIWQTIASVVRNAFVGAFARSLEGSISIRGVRENLSELSKSSGVTIDERRTPEEEESNGGNDSARSREAG